jgi:uncharacterized membrane protein
MIVLLTTLTPTKKASVMKVLKSIPVLYWLLCLGACHFLSGCSGPIVAEIAEGVTEGIIDEIEEYVQEKNHKK